MLRPLERITDPMVQEKDILRLVLGVCPALSVTTVAYHSLCMGLMVTLLLCCTNLILAFVCKKIPESVKVPIYITLLAGFVTMLQMIVEAYAPNLYQSLGDFIPFMVIYAMILGKITPSPVSATLDGLKMGLGFTLILTILGILRESIGAGTCFGMDVLPESVQPFTVMTSAPGVFLLFGLLLAFMPLFTREKQLEKSVAEEIETPLS